MGASEPATLVRNSSWAFIARVAGYVVSGGISIYAIRRFSEAEWGRYSTALALIAIFVVVSELGLSTLVLREMTARPPQTPRLLGIGVRAVARTALVSAILIVPAALLLGYSTATITLVAVGLPILLLEPMAAVVNTPFAARRKFVYGAQTSLLSLPVSACASVGLIAVGLGPMGLVLAAVISTGTGLAVAGRLLHTRLGVSPDFTSSSGEVRRFIWAAIPIALVGGVAVLYDRLDVLVLSALASTSDVAQYSVAYALVKLSWAIPSIVGAAFFPLYAELIRRRETEASSSFFLIMRVLGYMSGAIALFLTFAGKDLLTVMFGQRYAAAAGPLSILSWVLISLFQNYVLWYAILAANLERRVVPIQFAGLALNLAVNLLLIPRFGPAGAAMAFLFSDVFTWLAECVLVHKRVHRIPVARMLIRPLIAIVPAVLLGLWIGSEPPFLAGVAASVCFAVLLQATGYVSLAEWRPVYAPLTSVTLSRILPRRQP